jgi:hypothetical protein
VYPVVELSPDRTNAMWYQVLLAKPVIPKVEPPKASDDQNEPAPDATSMSMYEVPFKVTML